MGGVVHAVEKVAKPVLGAVGSVAGGPIGTAIGIGAGLLGSYLEGKKASNYYKQALAPTQKQLSMAQGIYNVTAPSYGLLAGMYERILKGDLNTPLYAYPRSQIELSTRQGLNAIRRNLAARGLGSSGLYGSMMARLYRNRMAELNKLYTDLFRQAQGFATTGVSLGLGQGGYAASSLARQYSALGNYYGGLAGSLGRSAGGLLGSLLYRNIYGG